MSTLECNCSTCAFAGLIDEDGAVECMEKAQGENVIIPPEFAGEYCDCWGETGAEYKVEVVKVVLNSHTITFERDNTVFNAAGEGFECGLIVRFEDSSWGRFTHLRDETLATNYVEQHVYLSDEQELYLDKFVRYLIEGEDPGIIAEVIEATAPELAAEAACEYVLVHGHQMIPWENAAAAMREDVLDSIRQDGYETPQEVVEEYESRDSQWLRSNSDYVYDRI